MNNFSPLPNTISSIDIIKLRKSTRTYSSLSISPEIKTNIDTCISTIKNPFGCYTRFVFLDKNLVFNQKKIRLGTYGWIQGASSFIAAICENNKMSLLQLGYQLEDIILFLTSLGLGTCWLAATYNKQSFSRVLELQKNEILPIVTPVGYPNWLRSPIDFLIKPIPSFKPRLEWNKLFFNETFSKSLLIESAIEYKIPLKMVRLAPSASNKQPWRILKQDNLYHFYLCHDPVYSHRYKFDVQLIDIGIAMFHFDIVSKELNLHGSWITNNPNIKDTPDQYEYIISWQSQ